MTIFIVRLVNGKAGSGRSTYEALVNAVGETKAKILCDFHKDLSPIGRWYAKNGVLYATCETIKS